MRNIKKNVKIFFESIPALRHLLRDEYEGTKLIDVKDFELNPGARRAIKHATESYFALNFARFCK